MIDGPYIYDAQNANYLKIDVNIQGEVIKEHVDKGADAITCYIDNDRQESFNFQLRKDHSVLIAPPPEEPERLVVISDIEGNFNAFQGLLLANGVINEAYDWIYGKGQLLLCGDMVDRGDNVIPVLWLIYKLEAQAQEAGGHVCFLFGNHEESFLAGKIKYVHSKYIEVSTLITKFEKPKKAFSALHNSSLILKQWLLQKDTIRKIGNVLFVHAGISIKLIEKGFDIEEINKLIRLGMPKKAVRPLKLIPKLQFLFSNKGPLWYRGMVMDYKEKYKKMQESEIDRVLDYFGVEHIVVGHSLVDEVSSDFNRKVFRIDIDHPEERKTGMAQGLLIESGNFYRIDDLGTRVLL